MPVNASRRRGRVLQALSSIATALCCMWSGFASAATPESPEVKAAIAKGVAFLEKAPADDRLGAKVLIGRVMLHQNRLDHPAVQNAVLAIRARMAAPEVEEATLIYSLGLSLVFLTELDPVLYRHDIDQVLHQLRLRQKANGGWGYRNRPEGDTSMTQYALYGLWSIEQHHISVDEDVWRRGADYLLRSQDREGGWPYQGTVPDSQEKISQHDIRRGMTIAALASLHLCGDYFDVFEFQKSDDAQPKLSPLLKPANVVRKDPPRVPPAPLTAAISTGENWLRAHNGERSQEYPFYELYTVERYETFRTAAKAVTYDPAVPTPWYDEGVGQLLKTQSDDGSWQASEGVVSSTAFAILFLSRSTRAAIRKLDALGAGTLVGGRGLAPGAATAKPPRRDLPVADDRRRLELLVERLDDPEFIATLSGLEDLRPIGSEPTPSELTKKLIKLARGESPEAKAAALRALGRSHDVAQAPILIEAILDPHPPVHQAAVDGLRFLTRDATNYGKPLSPDSAVRAAEADRWREWLRKVEGADR